MNELITKRRYNNLSKASFTVSNTGLSRCKYGIFSGNNSVLIIVIVLYALHNELSFVCLVTPFVTSKLTPAT